MSIGSKNIISYVYGYASSIEALHDLLNSCHITEISASLSHLSNGVQNDYFVKAWRENGGQNVLCIQLKNKSESK